MTPETPETPKTNAPSGGAKADAPSGGAPDHGQAREPGRGVRDQIARYRTAFTAVVVMIVIAAISGGYILAHERLSLPSWFPLVGSTHFMIDAEFKSGLALTPGQGQPVTIAGAKVGEVASVELRKGVARVGMEIEPKQARYIYRNATMLMRPRTQLKDETIELEKGTPSAGRVHEGEVFPLSQTAPDVPFEEFLSSLDAETRSYLQELLAAAGVALKENGRPLAADFIRFDPLTRDLQKITAELEKRHVYISHSIHNFRLFLTALGGKDKQLAEVLEASNKVFGVFDKENKAVEETVKDLPGTLRAVRGGLGKLTKAADVVTPTLKKLKPFAAALKPAQEQSRAFFKHSTPIIEEEIGPFAREVLPVLEKVKPATQDFNKALPSLASSFAVLNEFFNELAYNPGGKQEGFLFFLDWASHDFNSALSTADAGSVLGRTLLYLNCEVAPILTGVGEVNQNVKLLLGLLKPPEGKECEENHIPITREG
ncbi:MAG TPA: MlaD family protein [Solirubrobacteraceae bacterium]|jgi:phospholipid/cholesterol/gamma-HCH transport system substrate-binding protein